MSTLADLILAAAAASPDGPDPLLWIAGWLPQAERRELSAADLARIDAYRGGPGELHALLPTVVPLVRPRWYEAATTAQGGTRMRLGYGAVPASDCLDIGWACTALGQGRSTRIIGPLGPARLTATGMERLPATTDESWRELRSAAGIVLRALLLGLGTEIDPRPSESPLAGG